MFESREPKGWTVVATAPNQTIGESLVQLLNDEGIAGMVGPADAISFLGVAFTPVRVLAPDHDAERAREVLAELE